MKTLTSDQTTAVRAAAVRGVWFMAFDFNTPIYLNDSPLAIDWDGETWLPGTFLQFDELRETAAMEAVGLRITISGVPSALVSLALSENTRGKRFRQWLGLYDATETLIGAPALEFEGRCDVLGIADTDRDPAGLTSTISIPIESRIVDYARPNTRRYTDADQQKEFPGDGFFRHMPAGVEKQIVWPRADYWRK